MLFVCVCVCVLNVGHYICAKKVLTVHLYLLFYFFVCVFLSNQGKSNSMFFTLIIEKKNIEHQISILDWFLKDHVTLKTGAMMLKIGIN